MISSGTIVGDESRGKFLKGHVVLWDGPLCLSHLAHMHESHGRQRSRLFQESCCIVIPMTFLAVLFITSAQAHAKRRCQMIADGVFIFGRLEMTVWL